MVVGRLSLFTNRNLFDHKTKQVETFINRIAFINCVLIVLQKQPNQLKWERAGLQFTLLLCEILKYGNVSRQTNSRLLERRVRFCAHLSAALPGSAGAKKCRVSLLLGDSERIGVHLVRLHSFKQTR